MTDPRYPIGRFSAPASFSPDLRRELVHQITVLPAEMRAAVGGLTSRQLDVPYREGGWTVRQVVHHVVDSHMNGYVRFRWALTEDEPLIKTYDEKRWAELPDASTADVEPSLELLAALHRRWVCLLRSMQDEHFSRTLRHPERGVASLEHELALYAWHGRHHVAHIRSLRAQRGWT